MCVLEIELALEEGTRAEYPFDAMLRLEIRQHLTKEIGRVQPVEGFEVPMGLLFEQFAAFVVNVRCQRAIHDLPWTFAVDHRCFRDAPVEDRREVTGHDGFAVHDEDVASEAGGSEELLHGLEPETVDYGEQFVSLDAAARVVED